MPTPDFLTYGRERVLVGDGAMGTMLHAAGHTYDGSLAALNLSRPAVVLSIHESYIAAGSDVIQTNSFGASRLRLALHGQAEAVREINVAGAKIAREAAQCADHPVFVAGSVSPAVTAGLRSRVHADERILAHREQIEAFAEAGADLIILETFGYLDELVEAVEVASEFGLPIVAQATFTAEGLTLSGHSATDVAARLSDLPVSLIGVNCTVGPSKLVPVVTALADGTNLPLSVQPNAGQPERLMPQQHVRFAVDADYFASFVRPFVEAGAALIGGCCGTTPTIIRAVADQAATLRSTRSAKGSARRTPISTTGAYPLRRPEGLAARLAHGEFLVAVELTAPSVGTVSDALTVASRLRRCGVDLFFVPSEMGGRAQISSLSLAVALRQRVNVEPILAVSTLEKSVMTLQAEMLGAHALEIHGIVCETGGRPPVGDYPVRDDVWETDSLGLVALLRGLNLGRDCDGFSLKTTTEFVIGARCNLGRQDLETELARTLAKLRAGAGYIVTRPIYESGALQRLHDTISPAQIPVLAMVRPLCSEEEAAYLYYEVPDVNVTRASLEALRGSRPGTPQLGLELAEELLRTIRPMATGVVLSADREDQLYPLVDAALELRGS